MHKKPLYISIGMAYSNAASENEGISHLTERKEQNFPDGEVFSGPIEDSVNGTVCFSYPAVYDGNEVENVRLVFQNGKVVESSASRGLDFLNAMLDMDPGARFVGEVAFGLNYNIKRFMKETLFDKRTPDQVNPTVRERVRQMNTHNYERILGKDLPATIRCY